MEKIDLHLHVRREAPKANARPTISAIDEMLPHMKELGIRKGVLMSGGESDSGFGNNDEMAEICRLYPKHFAWMCNLDERDVDTVYARLADCKAKGAIGIGELMVNKRIDHPFLQTLFAAAEKLDLPVTIHMSAQEGFSYGIVDEPGLPLLEELLKTHPRLKILGHSQVFWIEMSKDAPKDKESRHKTGKGPVIPGGRLPELFSKYPNLYGDLSANSAGRAIMRDEKFGLHFLETYADRLFFATDMLTADTVYPLGNWLDEQAYGGRLSRDAYEKICFKNAERIFGL